ncbi:MAG: transposase [Candidatus Nitrosocosmicus sp.]
MSITIIFHLPTIKRIPDKLSYGMSLRSSFIKKSRKRLLVDRLCHTEASLMESYTYLTGCQWKMLPKEYGSGSTCHRRFQEWNKLDIFRMTWAKLLKIYDEKLDINWAWQSLDSISIKSPLGWTRLEIIPQIMGAS